MPKMTRQQLSLVPRAMLDYAVYGWLFFPLTFCVCEENVEKLIGILIQS